MKKIFLYITFITAILSTAGCSDDFNSSGDFQPALTARYLSTSATTFNFNSSDAFTTGFSVKSLDTRWRFSNVADWLTVEPMSGVSSAHVTMSGEANMNANSARTAIFYLESAEADWNFNRALSVSQAKASAHITTDKISLSFGGSASTQTVAVTANCEWEAKCNESWITLSSDPKSGNLSVSVSGNPTSKYRSGSVYLMNDGDTYVTISVTQSPSGIVTSAQTLMYENVASKYSVTIESEVDWTAVVSDSWISVNPQSGNAGKTTVDIEVTPNTSVSQRTGYVAIKTGTAQRLQIAIVQKGIYIEADESMAFSSQAESRKLKISSNTSWTVKEQPTWLTLSKKNGTGNDEITVTSTENASTTSRTGKIVLGQPGLSIDFIVNVTQLGKTVHPEATQLEFSDKGGTQNFNLIADYAWTSTVSGTWFTATPNSGTANATISVTAQENKTTEERNGIITYSFLNKTATVGVHQLAKYLTIDNSAFEYDTKGGTHVIDISTNDKWTVTTEPSASWLKISKTSGTGNASITLTAGDNASMSPRSCTVVINTENSQSVRIPISQNARYLTASVQSILFFAKGGVSETITISTNGQYSVGTDASWLTIKQTGNTFTVTATKNPTSNTRTGKISIKMTDLTSGTYSLDIPVTQAGEGGSFIIQGYPADGNWNDASAGSLNIKVTGYTTDKNWD